MSYFSEMELCQIAAYDFILTSSYCLKFQIVGAISRITRFFKSVEPFQVWNLGLLN